MMLPNLVSSPITDVSGYLQVTTKLFERYWRGWCDDTQQILSIFADPAAVAASSSSVVILLERWLFELKVRALHYLQAQVFLHQCSFVLVMDYLLVVNGTSCMLLVIAVRICGSYQACSQSLFSHVKSCTVSFSKKEGYSRKFVMDKQGLRRMLVLGFPSDAKTLKVIPQAQEVRHRCKLCLH